MSTLVGEVSPVDIPQGIFDLLDRDVQKEIQAAWRDNTLLGALTARLPFIRVTQNQAIALIRENQGFVSAQFRTSADVLKRGNPHPEVWKVWTANCIFGINWSGLLNRLLVKLGKEANYEASCRANGTEALDSKVSSKVIKGTGELQFYLTTTPVAYCGLPRYYDAVTGALLTVEEVAPFLKEHSQSKMERYGLTQESLEEIGVKSLPRFLTVKVNSLRSFKMHGQFFEVMD